MALGKNNKKETLPDIYDVRLLDGGIVMTLCFSIIFIWHNFTLAWITLAVYFIFVWFMDFENRSERYYIRFGNLPNKTRLRWKISMWILVVALYIYSFAIIFFEPWNWPIDDIIIRFSRIPHLAIVVLQFGGQKRNLMDANSSTAISTMSLYEVVCLRIVFFKAGKCSTLY